jgi:hypothetical protein
LEANLGHRVEGNPGVGDEVLMSTGFESVDCHVREPGSMLIRRGLFASCQLVRAKDLTASQDKQKIN